MTAMREDGGYDIQVLDLSRGGAPMRLTFGASNCYPVWTPDGKWLTFQSNRRGPWDTYRVPADASTEAQLLIEGESLPASWHPDGKTLAFEALAEYRGSRAGRGVTDLDIWMLDEVGGGTPRPVLQNEWNELFPAFSPNGDWLAYTSNETGRNEVYLRPYPALSPKIPVSRDGGADAVWSRDGSELFFRKGNQVYAVEVGPGSESGPGVPKFIFEGDYSRMPDNYDVAPDGRFVMIKVPDQGDAPTQIHVVLNWFEDLKNQSSRER
jgi:serine/threonine-protein kinase